MMKKITLLFVLLFLSIVVCVAQEERKISLNNYGGEKSNIEFGEEFSINLELTATDDEDNAKVDVLLENLSDSRGLVLFDRAYAEKTLKKNKMKFHKSFAGTKGQRDVKNCEGIDEIIYINQLDSKLVTSLSIKAGESGTIELPIYLFGYKSKKIIFGKEQRILTNLNVVKLVVDIDLIPNATYRSFEQRCKALCEEFDTLSFCNNPKHEPSLADQKKPFLDKVESLLTEIDDIMRNANWLSSDMPYQMYESLKVELQSMNLAEKEKDCGKHAVAPKVHRCKYCGLTLQQISHNLDDIYQLIYVSQDRTAAKNEQIKAVNALYNCAKRRSGWRKSEYNAKITRLYNDITRF